MAENRTFVASPCAGLIKRCYIKVTVTAFFLFIHLIWGTNMFFGANMSPLISLISKIKKEDGKRWKYFGSFVEC